MKDINDLMKTVLTADRRRLEDEIEDLEEGIALIENLFISCNIFSLRGLDSDVLRRCGDNEQLLHRRKKKLAAKLESKRKELESIMQRLEETE